MVIQENQFQIDHYLFEEHFRAFIQFIESQSNVRFESFESNPYYEKEERYKSDVYREGRQELGFSQWTESMIGSGEILKKIIKSIELKSNNLVRWQNRNGENARPHKLIYEAKENTSNCQSLEECIFKLYRCNQPEQSFNDLVHLIGKRYPVVAYLFFLKDCSKYLPIAPKTFEESFNYLGVDIKLSHNCTWESYQIFIRLINQIKSMLMDVLMVDVTLLDAHSFVWILAQQMKKHNVLPNVEDYKVKGPTDRLTFIYARVGQKKFREDLLDYWKENCAVTGLSKLKLLRASHIKPRYLTEQENRNNSFNGLLLAANVDAVFDNGFISFDENVNILISSMLNSEDAKKIGIYNNMSLRKKLDERHKPFLKYHRENVFKP